MRKTIAALAALLALGACSNGGTATDQKEPEPTKQAQEVEPAKVEPVTTINCDDLKTAKTVPTGIENGCWKGGTVEAPKEIVSLGVWDCSDGTKLLGEGDMWGYVGKEAHHETPETSPAYAKAYEECGG